MKFQDVLVLIILAAIWGGSFIFMRVLAPVLGPIMTADARLLIGGLALLVYFFFVKFDPQWKLNLRHYIIIGVVNCAIPFSLFSFAALHIPASYSVIINATTPLFGAFFSALWLGEEMTIRKFLGITLGAIGVGFVVEIGTQDMDLMFTLSILACLVAAMGYALSSIYVKRFATTAKPRGIACGSQIMAGLALVPFIALSPVRSEITPMIIYNMLGLALLCSSVAFLLYYRLLERVGPTKALTVTFLMPVFGIIWGVMFLNEKVTVSMIFGTALVIIGTVLVLGLFKKKQASVV